MTPIQRQTLGVVLMLAALALAVIQANGGRDDPRPIHPPSRSPDSASRVRSVGEVCARQAGAVAACRAGARQADRGAGEAGAAGMNLPRLHAGDQLLRLDREPCVDQRIAPLVNLLQANRVLN